jgi:hypothetical protein
LMTGKISGLKLLGSPTSALGSACSTVLR